MGHLERSVEEIANDAWAVLERQFPELTTRDPDDTLNDDDVNYVLNVCANSGVLSLDQAVHIADYLLGDVESPYVIAWLNLVLPELKMANHLPLLQKMAELVDYLDYLDGASDLNRMLKKLDKTKSLALPDAVAVLNTPEALQFIQKLPTIDSPLLREQLQAWTQRICLNHLADYYHNPEPFSEILAEALLTKVVSMQTSTA